MSKTNKKPMDNAEEIIERFGGIRPMSQKIDVAFTTIQGWKKRGTIPAGRRAAILNAAIDHNIDLSGITDVKPEPMTLSSDADHVDSLDTAAGQDDAAPKKVIDIPKAPAPSVPPSASREEAVERSRSNIEAELAKMEKKMMKKNMLFTSALTLLVVGAAAFLLWPKADDNAARIEAMQAEMAAMEAQIKDEKKSGLNALLPANLKAQIDGQINDLKTQANEMKAQVSGVQEQVSSAVNRAQDISSDVLGEQAGNLEQRLSRLEGHMSELIGSPELTALFSRFQMMQSDAAGQGQLANVVQELNKMFEKNENLAEEAMPMDGAGLEPVPNDSLSIDGVLQKAKDQSAAIGQTFEGVPTGELKAAGLLLGFTQVRGALNRDGQPFAEDLELLTNLIGDNPDLQAQIQKLAPHAESGVLTPSGLSSEFRTLAGDMVVSSLKGEDVSVKDRASAKLNQLLQVEKDGELLTGTPTQATVNSAQNKLEQGDLAGAIAAAKSLQGPQAQMIAPWIAKAEATLAGQNLEGLLGGFLSGQGISGAGLPNGLGGALMPKTLIQDKTTGINILAPAKLSLPELSQ